MMPMEIKTNVWMLYYFMFQALPSTTLVIKAKSTINSKANVIKNIYECFTISYLKHYHLLHECFSN